MENTSPGEATPSVGPARPSVYLMTAFVLMAWVWVGNLVLDFIEGHRGPMYTAMALPFAGLAMTVSSGLLLVCVHHTEPDELRRTERLLLRRLAKGTLVAGLSITLFG